MAFWSCFGLNKGRPALYEAPNSTLDQAETTTAPDSSSSSGSTSSQVKALSQSTTSASASGQPTPASGDSKPDLPPQQVCKVQEHLITPSQLFASFSLSNCLGKGGFAAVYAGSWHAVPVAIKLIRTDDMNRRVAVMEALIGQEVPHPHVALTFAWQSALVDAAWLQSLHTQEPGAQQPGGAAPAAAAAAAAPAAPAAPVPSPAQPATDQHAAGIEGGVSHDDTFSGDGFGPPMQRGSATISSVLADVGVKEGEWLTAIVMERAEYGTLHQVLHKSIFCIAGAKDARDARLKGRALLRTACEVAKGLSHLHSSDVVHGDLKPSNILCFGSRKDRRGFIAKISDFGLSKMVPGNGTLQLSHAQGTMVYMAPEVSAYGHLSRAADIYSFGILLYEMATCEVPYGGMQHDQVALQVSLGKLRPHWPPGLFPQLQAVFKRCMAHHPQDRPTAEELIELLNELEDGVRRHKVAVAVPRTPTLKEVMQEAASRAAATGNATVKVRGAKSHGK